MSAFTQRHYETIADSLNETLEACLGSQSELDTVRDRAIVRGTMEAVVDNLVQKFKVDNSSFKEHLFRDRALR